VIRKIASGSANFYEKALFVKVDLATALWWMQRLSLCPSRYASIRTFGELTLVARCIGWDPS
jgi:hypothetical protein